MTEGPAEDPTTQERSAPRSKVCRWCRRARVSFHRSAMHRARPCGQSGGQEGLSHAAIFTRGVLTCPTHPAKASMTRYLSGALWGSDGARA